MQDLDFEKELKQAEEKLEKNTSQIKFTRKNIKRLQDYMCKTIKNEEGFEKNVDEFKTRLHQEYNNVLQEYKKISGTRILQKQVYALKTINNNPYILDKVYKKLEKRKLSNINFENKIRKLKGTEEEFEENEIAAQLQWIRREDNKINQEVIEVYRKICNEKNIEKRKKYKEILKKRLKNEKDLEYLEIFSADTEKEKLRRSLKIREKSIEELMLNLQKQQLKQAGEFFKNNKMLEDLTKFQNTDYRNLNIPEMQYSTRKKRSEKDITVEEIFEDKYIDSLNSIQLAILNAFWQNRFSKKVTELGRILFISDTLNFWENYKSRDLISSENIKNVLLKEEICDKIFEQIKGDTEEKIKEENVTYSIVNTDVLSQQIKQEYEEYFNSKIPHIENNLVVDMKLGEDKRNLENLLYHNKATMVQELFLGIEHNPKITNWGLIPENNTNIAKKENIKEKKRILIGIDYPGFNMPLRLHVNREAIVKLLKIRKNNTVIPIYVGDNTDFRYKGKNLTTKLFMPLTEDGEDAIIKANKNISAVDSRYGYIRHLGNLITKKVKSISKIYPNKYIDLESGLEGIKTRDNNFVPDNITIDEKTKMI